MFKLCLFDLDNTLLRTSDLEWIRKVGKCTHTREYRKRVAAEFSKRYNREIYSTNHLNAIRKNFPSIKIGVFTRSRRSYAQTILKLAYPTFEWDDVIAYEDVSETKPYGTGIEKAMKKFGIRDPKNVLMVGDSASDIKAAYNAGAAVVLDKSTWVSHTRDNWRSLELIPDVIIRSPKCLLSVMQKFQRFLPNLERLIAGESEVHEFSRYDRVNKFISKAVAWDQTPYPIFVSGRFFSHPTVTKRANWHMLSKSVRDNKESIKFPREWVQNVYEFIKSRNKIIGSGLIVTVVPCRPGTLPRLEYLLNQCEAHFSANPFPGSSRITFESKLLAYREGVRSHRKEQLDAVSRFRNVRDHLYVRKRQSFAAGKSVLVIDDVCTTGASLIYASKYLEDAGSGMTKRLAFSMNIGNVLYD